MPIELITGVAGSAHVDSADVGAMLAALVGSESYILDGGSATIVDANTVKIAKGEFLLEGRHVRITGSGINATIDNGEVGKKRNDLICMRYQLIQGIESVVVAVLKGTSTTGDPTDPTVPDASILDGDSDVYIPLYRVSLNGLTPQTPVKVISGSSDLLPVADPAYALPIEKGGTGASSAAAALEELGGVSYTKVWENASPSSTFPPQTISVDLSGYDSILIISNWYYLSYGTIDEQHFSSMIDIGVSGLCFAINNSADEQRIHRGVVCYSNSIYFANCYIYGVVNIPGVSNIHGIPIKIYGIKGIN